jgi:hypothetical protein
LVSIHNHLDNINKLIKLQKTYFSKTKIPFNLWQKGQREEDGKDTSSLAVPPY